MLAQLTPPLSKERATSWRKNIAGNQHWTGLGLDGLVKAVEDEWPVEGNQRGLLWEIYELDAFQANHHIHHGHAGLASVRNEPPGKRSYNVARRRSTSARRSGSRTSRMRTR